MTETTKDKIERYFENMTTLKHLLNLMHHSSIFTKDNLFAFLFDIRSPVLMDSEIQEFFKDSIRTREITILNKERFFQINKEVGLSYERSEELWVQFPFFVFDNAETEKKLRDAGKKLLEQN